MIDSDFLDFISFSCYFHTVCSGIGIEEPVYKEQRPFYQVSGGRRKKGLRPSLWLNSFYG